MKQFAWFDCLRCVAIFLVMIAHGGDFWRSLPEPSATMLNALWDIAWVGVELFFVLSGFLVSGLLFYEHDKTGALNIQRFLIRRGFKIVPAFYFLLIVTIIFNGCTGRELKADHLFHDFFFIQNYRIGTWSHGWTLALEVHFYILLSVLLYFLARRSRGNDTWLKPLPWILAGVMAASFVVRLINSYARGVDHHFDVHSELERSQLHLDVLAAGVLLRYLYNYHPERLAFLNCARWSSIALGLALVWPSEYLFTPHPPWLTAFIPTLDALGFGLILYQATQLPFPVNGLAHWFVKPFDYLGKHSYSIYLWHMPVRDWLIAPYFAAGNPAYFFIYFPASLVVGVFFSEVLEMPMLRMRDWLFPSRVSSTSLRTSGAPAT